ncbi:MAG: hypothetical protein IPK08_20025 [Bacteroidetes bacterium]|nr:hypothetical protein [Bacteroidota bacterium]
MLKRIKKGNGFGFGLVDLKVKAEHLVPGYYKDGSEILIPQERKKSTPTNTGRMSGTNGLS